MAHGHPDYLDWPGRAAVGVGITSYSFSAPLSGETTGTIDLPVVPAGQENVYQCISISCNDDTAIHEVTLSRVADAWFFFRANFILGDIFDFPGQAIAAGETVRITLTNNSASTLTFEGAVFYTSRPV